VAGRVGHPQKSWPMEEIKADERGGLDWMKIADPTVQ